MSCSIFKRAEKTGAKPLLFLFLLVGFISSLSQAQTGVDSISSMSRIYIDQNNDNVPDHINEKITITGIVNVSSGILHEHYLQSFIQNDSIGASIFAKEIDTPFEVGDSLVVNGTIQQYNGLKEVQVDSYEVYPNYQVPDPKPLKQAIENPAKHIGMLIEGEGKIVEKGSTFNGKYLTVSLSDTSKSSMMVYVSNFHHLFDDFNFDVLSIGDEISVTGVIGEYSPRLPEDRNFMLFLRTPDDLKYSGFPRYYLYLSFGGLVLVAALVGGWIISLRRKVSRKTAELQKSLDDKETLLREIHHRVKNNLSIISGLIGFQLDSTDDEVAQRVLKDSQSRIHSMAMIHDKLYQTESLSDISLDNYIKDLVQSIHGTFSEYQDSVDLQFNLDEVQTDIDKVIPCGLLINELVVNSFKHAFSKKDRGVLSIELKRNNGKVELEIADNGPGLPDDFELGGSGSLGSMLIKTFASQLDAETEVEGKDGSTFRFRFSQN